ncbi:MAG TPA: N-acetylmuramoyl-L-alanine amidase [Thermoanaerobaculia bacterium]|jgi:N-acetylmuramoyl-L-alanine amidase
MKRFTILGFLAVLAVASIVLAQQPQQAILRTQTGDTPVTYVLHDGHTFFAAGDVVSALGGQLTPESTGFKVALGGAVAAFGTDSRYGVVGEDLIEMPVPPQVIDGKPFVPWQFFQGLLRKSSSLDVTWDATTKVLSARPLELSAVSVQASLANVQGISKIVLTMSGPVEYTIVKEPGAYAVRFKSTIRAPFGEQTYEDPYVQKLSFSADALRIQLTAADVVADAYQLEEPFRIVLDMRKAAAPIPGATTPLPGIKPVEQPGIRTIVIDPGHGGKEVGAVGSGGLYEKDATLALCRKLAASLQSATGARVVMTRDDDSLVSLDQRTAIANQYGADLFLSVHLNAAVVKGAKGAETYFLSLEASDELARKAAETENTAAAQHATADPSADLKLILWDLAQQEYLQESSRFASTIQEELNTVTGVANRGVKQAPFKVLVGATMPAALVEVAFISNPEEEAKIQTDEFQKTMIDAITRAVQRYKTEYETRIGVAHPAPAAPPLGTTPAPAATATAAPAPAATPRTTP